MTKQRSEKVDERMVQRQREIGGAKMDIQYRIPAVRKAWIQTSVFCRTVGYAYKHLKF